MTKYTHTYGGVGAPVGLTVFKTAGGSLGAAPGGFDSHTPLLPYKTARTVHVFLPMVLHNGQDYASFSAMQNYASLFSSINDVFSNGIWGDTNHHLSRNDNLWFFGNLSWMVSTHLPLTHD